jgi:hypothetical protein
VLKYVFNNERGKGMISLGTLTVIVLIWILGVIVLAIKRAKELTNKSILDRRGIKSDKLLKECLLWPFRVALLLFLWVTDFFVTDTDTMK